jgi:hypothetical protein
MNPVVALAKLTKRGDIISMKKTSRALIFKLPAFLRGFASAFDITGQTLLDLPDFNTGFQRDAEALRSDWRQVGNSLRAAMDSLKYTNENSDTIRTK